MDGVVFRTVDVIRWGAAGGLGTGGNLTPVQFDENMWEFLRRIRAIEINPPTAVGITGFTVIGSQFQVNMSNATTLGPYDLPIAQFRDRGVWANNVPLLPLDLFSVNGFGLYMVKIAHTTPVTPATFDPGAVSAIAGPTFGLPLYQLVYGEQEYIYDLGFFYPGRPGIGIEDGGSIAGHVFVHDVKAPAGLTGSRATLKIAASAALSFPIKYDGSVVGSVDFASGAIVGTFTFAGIVSIASGKVLTLIKPTAVDVDARELSVTFKMIRSF